VSIPYLPHGTDHTRPYKNARLVHVGTDPKGGRVGIDPKGRSTGWLTCMRGDDCLSFDAAKMPDQATRTHMRNQAQSQALGTWANNMTRKCGGGGFGGCCGCCCG
jgi:hypothetical protein